MKIDNTSESKAKQHFFPMRDPDNTKRITLVPISDELYYQLYPEIWRIRKREQRQGRCKCPKSDMWKCDADCDLCEYHSVGNIVSLDSGILEENEEAVSLLNLIFEPETSPECVIEDKDILEQLLKRLAEIMPEAIEIGIMRMQDITDEDIADSIGVKRQTLCSRIKKIRKSLKEEFGIDFPL